LHGKQSISRFLAKQPAESTVRIQKLALIFPIWKGRESFPREQGIDACRTGNFGALNWESNDAVEKGGVDTRASVPPGLTN
jgi:hypothetical protein